MLVLRTVLRTINNQHHARLCMRHAIANERIDLIWVLLSRFHPTVYDSRPHYTIRGFLPNGRAEETLHVYSFTEKQWFRNGGSTFGRGRVGRALNFHHEI
ncbi:hypothetical protein NMY22_g13836 [Coprinellus aureogranulatus]|nr:hypothetical protein NMY22_g13836 [Coprinellus aureogranulatus]